MQEERVRVCVLLIILSTLHCSALSLSLSPATRAPRDGGATWRIRIALTPWPFCQMCFENACKIAAVIAVVAAAAFAAAAVSVFWGVQLR